jgi:acetoin utilization protein AcuC
VKYNILARMHDGMATSAVPRDIAAASVYIGSEIFRRPAFVGNHPLNIVRHSAVFDLVRMLDWLPEGVFRRCTAASVEQLAEFHDRSYIDALQYADSTGRVEPRIRDRYRIGTLENPLFPGVFERAATTVGGSVLAAQLAYEGHIVFHPSGGTHHGRRDRASGFCYFNDPVFAILTLLELGCDKVMYVDLDAHHGDGVEAAFAHVPQVMTASIHEESRWPYSGSDSGGPDSSIRNMPVPPGLNDSELDYLLEHAILPLADHFEPDALVLCCGADCLAGDPLSGMNLSNVALWDVIERLAGLGQPTVVLGGGGYNPWTVARYWAGLWGRLSGQALPDRLPADAEALLRGMECDLVDEDEVNAAWYTTLVDSPYDGPIRDRVVSVAAAVVDAEWSDNALA